MKRINKILWHGVDIPIPSAYEGSLDGLNCGELYIYENDEDPAIFIKTNKNKVKRIGGGGGGTTDINEILDLIDQKLNGYATEEWVSSTYATKTALSTLSSSVNSLRTDFDNLNALLNDDVTGKINTWYEVVDFLDEYSGSQDLAAILSGMNTDIASRVEKSKFADYFATEMAKWFVKDDANKGIKPVNSYGLYSDTYVSAKGVSTGTGGSGGGSSYDRLDRWSDYTTDKAGWVLSALLGQDLNSRVASLESGSALSVTTSGSGNAVTGVSKSGNQLVITKGATFLTEHQSLAGYQPLITSGNKLDYSLISGTPTSLPASDVAAWAKAASKPSYAFSEITNKPTTLNGYGITDAYTASAVDGKLSGYLPLSGGTIEDSIGGAFSVNRINGVEAYIKLLSRGVYKGAITAGNDTYGVALYNAVNGYCLGITNDGNPYYLGASRYTLIHSGNIGSQSVASATTAGDSDMLGGVTHSNYMISFRSATQDVNQSPYTAERPYILRVGSGNANLPAGMQYGNIAHFSAYGADTAFELFGAYSGQTLLYRCGETNAMFSKGWKTIAFTDSNVASATKLQTPRSIWGQSFDGTGDVNGELSIYGGMLVNKHNESDNVAKSAIIINKGGDYFGIGTSTVNVSNLAFGLCSRDYNWISEQLVITNSGNVLIGTAVDNGARLQVGGSVVASGSVTAKSSSDYRLKCAFDYNVDYQERLLSLGKVCDFNYTPHAQEREFAFADDRRHTSVIWQDARKANITGFCSVEEDGYGTVNPLSSDLIFTMVGAIQQGIVKTERIEERVVRLEKENAALRKEINDMKGGRYGC